MGLLCVGQRGKYHKKRGVSRVGFVTFTGANFPKPLEKKGNLLYNGMLVSSAKTD